MATKRRRKKKDPFYKALLWVLIACGAVLLYENLSQLGKNNNRVTITQEPNKTSTPPKLEKLPETKIEKTANLKANQDWDQTTLKATPP